VPAVGTQQALRRVRALGDAAVRRAEGVCVVEGIRPVLAAEEAGLPFEAVLVCPQSLRSAAAWAAVERLQHRGVPRVDLPVVRFRQLSEMDHPVGLAAIVSWAPRPLADLTLPAEALVLVAEGVGDAGNLGTILRTADAAGAAAVVVAGAGADPSHRRTLRASLGSAFRLPVALAADGPTAVRWARAQGLTAVAGSPHAEHTLWDVPYPRRVALVVGSEERGLAPETAAACPLSVRVPMWGSADSLNVAVAAGVLLYAVRRQWLQSSAGAGAVEGARPR
jgi:TrmH family RNA methyltransferase